MKNYRYKLTSVLLLAMFATACAVSPNVFYDADPQQDFGLYKTFTWHNDDPVLIQSDYVVSAFVQTKLKESVKTELEAKGYRFVANLASADMAVAITVGARDKVKIYQEPTFINDQWRWGIEYWRPHRTTTTTAVNYVNGTLAVDVFDANKKAPVWHGRGSKRLTKAERQGNADNIESGIATILANFPKR
jgi:hypothetical protein